MKCFHANAKSAHRVAYLIASLCVLSALLSEFAFAKDEPKWIEVRSQHFSVLTDAGEKRGREVALRMEQMRAVFGQLLLKEKLNVSVPITVVAFKSDKQFAEVAPTKQSLAGGFYVPGYDRIYIGLNLFEMEPWRSVEHSLAHYFLNYNYPPAQGWFDEGMAEYFGSVQIGKEVNLGADPELAPEWHEDIFDNMVRDPNTPQSLTQLVSSPVWIGIVDLFTMKHDGSGLHEGSHSTLYYAQSWMVVHYLINKKKMPEVGTYFDLVLNQKMPVDKAIVQAFDLTPAQMEEAVRAYFNSLGNLGVALDQAKKPTADPAYIMQPDHSPLLFTNDDLVVTVTPVADNEAKAIVDDMMARVPEHRDQALRDLQALAADPRGNEAAHRGLARDHIQQKLFDEAAAEIDKATDVNANDPWVWYYRSVLKYRKAQSAGQDMQGVANVMQDLKGVVSWSPNMADAYNMLAMARLEGGGPNAALDAQKQAIALAPRNAEYQFNLAQMYVAGKKWDQAREIFTHLKEGNDRQAASAAKQALEDMATLQKYGVPPARPGDTNATANSGGTAADESDTDQPDTASKPQPSKPASAGPIENVKGKIVESDCSKAPAALITIISGMTTFKMHTADIKTLLVIGGDRFSCDWKNLPVSVNYRPTGGHAGEAVSIELR